MNELRRFKKEDWYGYAGASKFSNGTEPFIFEAMLNEGTAEMSILADAEGIEINLCDCKSHEVTTYWKNIKLNAMRAEGEMRQLTAYISKTFVYAPDLTYALDHPTSYNEVLNGFEFAGTF